MASNVNKMLFDGSKLALTVKFQLKRSEIFGGNVESDYLCTRFSGGASAEAVRKTPGGVFEMLNEMCFFLRCVHFGFRNESRKKNFKKNLEEFCRFKNSP